MDFYNFLRAAKSGKEAETRSLSIIFWVLSQFRGRRIANQQNALHASRDKLPTGAGPAFLDRQGLANWGISGA